MSASGKLRTIAAFLQGCRMLKSPLLFEGNHLHTTKPQKASEFLPRSAAHVSLIRLVFSADRGIVNGVFRLRAEGCLNLGRSAPKDEVRIEHDGCASREHARIVRSRDGSLHVIDLDSKNGTFVDGTRVQRCALRDGSVVRVGDSFVIVRTSASDEPSPSIPALRGVSPAIASLRMQVARTAQMPADTNVLLLGETGSGKDVVAQSIHDLTPSRAAQKMVAVNCAAVPDSLCETIFFGHVNRFISDSNQHDGHFQMAHGSTLFLDEIGDASPKLQALLLRVVETRLFTPLGARAPKSCDVRIIAATNCDLLKSISAGRFRSDLYARLSQIELAIPSLRARREDVLLLLQHFFAAAGKAVSPTLVAALLAYDFPLNVRDVIRLAKQLQFQGSGQDGDDVGRALLARIMRVQQGEQEPPRNAPQSAEADARAANQLNRQNRKIRFGKNGPDPALLKELLAKADGNINQVAKEIGYSWKQTRRFLDRLEPAKSVEDSPLIATHCIELPKVRNR